MGDIVIPFTQDFRITIHMQKAVNCLYIFTGRMDCDYFNDPLGTNFIPLQQSTTTSVCSLVATITPLHGFGPSLLMRQSPIRNRSPACMSTVTLCFASKSMISNALTAHPSISEFQTPLRPIYPVWMTVSFLTKRLRSVDSYQRKFAILQNHIQPCRHCRTFIFTSFYS